MNEEMTVLDNIAEVVNGGLCTGCGTCAGVCPTHAIAMRVSKDLFLPEIDEDKCTRCRICVQCCPGYSVDLGKWSVDIFGKLPEDRFLGCFRECYVGHSNDEEIRFSSSSGGVVTQILVYALERGLIDGALVVRMREDRPLEPEPFIARTREEVISASKSKYCPVAANVVLKKILSEDGKFAVVGLPCHIHGIRKAEMVFKELREKIVLHVGLFCGHTVNFMGTDLLLKKFHVEKSDVVRLDYRGKGWPGFMSIRRKDGRNLDFRFVRGWNAYWNVFSSFFFTPLRCMMCSDQFNELSDISVGDAWLPELKGNNAGESVLITRTAIAEEMLALVKHSGGLSLWAISQSKVKESQAFSLNFNKENISGRLFLLRMLGKKTPNINPKPCSSGFLALLGAFLSYLSFYVSSNKRLRSLLVYVPLPLFRLYFGLFKCTFLLSTHRG
jgi:coenzyme F420 hydrogenase subunit beta